MPSPTVEGPVSGGAGTPFVAATTFDLAQVGYPRRSTSSPARRALHQRRRRSAPTASGRRPGGDRAAYKTRILVYRPIDAARVQRHGRRRVAQRQRRPRRRAGLDHGAHRAHPRRLRLGGRLGAEGRRRRRHLGARPAVDAAEDRRSRRATARCTIPATASRTTSSRKPGRRSATAPASRRSASCRSQRVIAAGESQSAFRMVTYINAVHPLAGVYDGFLVHSRGGFGVPLSEAPQPDDPGARHGADPRRPRRPRADLRDRDRPHLARLRRRPPARQRPRAHSGRWPEPRTPTPTRSSVGATDLGRLARRRQAPHDQPSRSPAFDVRRSRSTPARSTSCSTPRSPRWSAGCATGRRRRWRRAWRSPPARRPSIVRDPHGNALGGIRTPQVDVPIAALSGERQSGSLFCLLFGTTVLFDAATLAALYPDHATYVAAFNAATDAAVQAGFVLPPDAELMKAPPRTPPSASSPGTAGSHAEEPMRCVGILGRPEAWEFARSHPQARCSGGPGQEIRGARALDSTFEGPGPSATGVVVTPRSDRLRHAGRARADVDHVAAEPAGSPTSAAGPWPSCAGRSADRLPSMGAVLVVGGVSAPLSQTISADPSKG